MDLSNINFLAVLVAAIASMVLGGLWYSPLLFANTWMKENGFTEESMKGRNPITPMLSAFFLNIVMAFVMAIFVSNFCGLHLGLITGAFAAISIGIMYLFEGRSLKLFLINAGYSALNLIIMGLIIGGWR